MTQTLSKDFESACGDARETRLFHAIADDDLLLVKSLLDGGVSVNARGRAQDTPLILATHLGRFSIMEELLKRKADPDLQNDKGETAMLYAASAAQDAGRRIGLLAQYKANLHIPEKDGDTPLTAAIADENVEAIEALLAAGCTPADVNGRGYTALNAAAGAKPAALEALLSQKPDLNALNPQGYSPLHIALAWGNKRGVKLLLDAGADPEICMFENGKKSDSALAYALKNCRGDILSMMQEANKKFNLLRCLMWRTAEEECLEHINGGKIPLDLIDCHRETALSRVVKMTAFADTDTEFSGRHALLKPLLKRGVDPNQIVNMETGETVLFMLASAGDFTVPELDLLIAYGAKPNVRNRKGQAPWEVLRAQADRPVDIPFGADSWQVSQIERGRELAKALADHMEQIVHSQIRDIAKPAATARTVSKIRPIAFD